MMKAKLNLFFGTSSSNNSQTTVNNNNSAMELVQEDSTNLTTPMPPPLPSPHIDTDDEDDAFSTSASSSSSSDSSLDCDDEEDEKRRIVPGPTYMEGRIISVHLNQSINRLASMIHAMLNQPNIEWSESKDSRVEVEDVAAILVYLLKNSPRSMPDTLIVGFIYLERLLENSTKFDLTIKNWRPLCSTAFLLANKVWDDYSFGNAHIARIMGFRPRTMNQYERCFLNALNYDVGVSEEDWKRLCGNVIYVPDNNTRSLLRRECMESNKENDVIMVEVTSN